MKKTLIIKILPATTGGWVCIAANGEKPFEGKLHPSYKAAIDALDAAYRNDTWHGHRVTDSRTRKQVYEIDID